MRCVIICGSPDCDFELIKATVRQDDYVICADKGYSHAKKAGINPHLIVGDFDSYTDNDLPECEIIKLDVHKDDTDTMHAIDVAIERGYREFVLLAAMGGRFDHTFANVSILQYLSINACTGLILTPNEKILYLPEGEYSFTNYKNKTFSLFPFACEKVCVTYKGTQYKAKELVLTSYFPMGVSNVFDDENSSVKICYGNAIIIINLSNENN